jgi:hypothetical protein
MSSTMSTSPSTCSRQSRGVDGFRATDGRAPAARMAWIVRCRWGETSACTEIRSAPAFAKASTYRSGSTIMRWASMGSRVTLRTASTTSGPMVMLGTNRPSMTSTWIQSAPAASTARTSSASRPKSAERIEGAMRMGMRMRLA